MEGQGRRSTGRAANAEGRPAPKKQEPVSLMDPARYSRPPKRRREERTVYRREQLEVLEEYFARDRYPGYRVREDLATRLNLQEYKVQVWFKNRRARCSRLKRLSQGQDQGPPNASMSHRAPDAPDPEPEPAAAPAAAGPAFLEGPAFCSPSPPSPAGTVPAPEASISSGGPAGWVPAQGLQEVFPAALAPAPAPGPGRRSPYSLDFWPEPVVVFDFTDLFPLQDPSQGPPSPLLSECEKGDDSADETRPPSSF